MRWLRSKFGRASESPRPSPITTPTDEDIRLAALTNLSPLPSFSALFPRSDAQLDRGQVWIDTKRAWAESLPDRRVAKAYLRWIDFVQSQLNENREENRTHAKRDEHEEWRRNKDVEWDTARALAQTIPKPPR